MTDSNPWTSDQDKIAANLAEAAKVPARSGAAQRRRRAEKQGAVGPLLCARCFQPTSAHGSGGAAGVGCAEFVVPSGPFAEADQADGRRLLAEHLEPGVPAMLHESEFPAGPYRRGLTKYSRGRTGRPYVIHAANGQCIAGWIDSRACVDAIVAALNAQYPT